MCNMKSNKITNMKGNNTNNVANFHDICCVVTPIGSQG